MSNSKPQPVPVLIRVQQRVFQSRRQRLGIRSSDRLWDSLLSPDNLHAAWERVSENDGAETPGVDGLACRHWRGQIDARLRELREQLRTKQYRPAAVRHVVVPKSSGSGTRTLGILTVRDRLVQTALKQILEPILEPGFLPNSFGFRPGRSVVSALDAALRPLNAAHTPVERKFRSGVQLDVADCFESIDHATLRWQLREQMTDDQVLALLDLILNHSGREVGWWRWRRRVGLVQGSGLSPLLCNLALHPLDLALAELAKRTGQRVLGLRYADDLLLLTSDETLARQALKVATQTLDVLRLTIRRDKLQQARLHDGIEWLGVRLQPRPALAGRPPVFGYVIPDTKIIRMLAKLDDLTQIPTRGSCDMAAILKSLNEQMRQWREAYVFADNAQPVFELVDQIAQERVQRLLQQQQTGKGELQPFRHKLPRGFWTWKINGVQLVNLSSLAPRRPDRLIHKPQWMRDER